MILKEAFILSIRNSPRKEMSSRIFIVLKWWLLSECVWCVIQLLFESRTLHPLTDCYLISLSSSLLSSPLPSCCTPCPHPLSLFYPGCACNSSWVVYVPANQWESTIPIWTTYSFLPFYFTQISLPSVTSPSHIFRSGGVKLSLSTPLFIPSFCHAMDNILSHAVGSLHLSIAPIMLLTLTPQPYHPFPTIPWHQITWLQISVGAWHVSSSRRRKRWWWCGRAIFFLYNSLDKWTRRRLVF